MDKWFNYTMDTQLYSQSVDKWLKYLEQHIW